MAYLDKYPPFDDNRCLNGIGCRRSDCWSVVASYVLASLGHSVTFRLQAIPRLVKTWTHQCYDFPHFSSISFILSNLISDLIIRRSYLLDILSFDLIHDKCYPILSEHAITTCPTCV